MDETLDDLKKKNEELLRVIDTAYWMLEVGDRIGVLKILAPYAKPRSINGEQK